MKKYEVIIADQAGLDLLTVIRVIYGGRDMGEQLERGTKNAG